MAGVEQVEVGVVGLPRGDDGILEADALEGLVPFQDAGGHRGAVALRHVAVDPEGDGLDGLRQRRLRVLLLQPPAVDVVAACDRRHVVGHVDIAVGEEAHARVGGTRGHRRGREVAEVHHVTDEQAGAGRVWCWAAVSAAAAGRPAAAAAARRCAARRSAASSPGWSGQRRRARARTRNWRGPRHRADGRPLQAGCWCRRCRPAGRKRPPALICAPGGRRWPQGWRRSGCR